MAVSAGGRRRVALVCATGGPSSHCYRYNVYRTFAEAWTRDCRDMLANRQTCTETDEQTDGHTHHTTPLLCRVQSKQ